jgi:hypothetical protein
VTLPSLMAPLRRDFTCDTAPSNALRAGLFLPTALLAARSDCSRSWAMRPATSCFSFSTVIAPLFGFDAVLRFECFEAADAARGSFEPSAWALSGMANRETVSRSVEIRRIGGPRRVLPSNHPGLGGEGSGGASDHVTYMCDKDRISGSTRG